MGGSYVGDLGQTLVLQRVEDSPVKTEGTDTSANFGESSGKGTSATRKLKARGCSMLLHVEAAQGLVASSGLQRIHSTPSNALL